MAKIEQTVIQLLEWWQLSLRRDVAAILIRAKMNRKLGQMGLFMLNGTIYNNNEGENPKIPKRNPRI